LSLLFFLPFLVVKNSANGGKMSELARLQQLELLILKNACIKPSAMGDGHAVKSLLRYFENEGGDDYAPSAFDGIPDVLSEHSVVRLAPHHPPLGGLDDHVIGFVHRHRTPEKGRYWGSHVPRGHDLQRLVPPA